MELLLIACGGALGAVARFVSVTTIHRMMDNVFPLGTLFVNCLGAFLIGFGMSFILNRLAINAEQWRVFLIVGFLGGFTTFSSFAWETIQLINNGLWGNAILNIVLNNLGTLVLVIIGIQAGRLIGST